MQFPRHLDSVVTTRAANQLLGLLAKLAKLLVPRTRSSHMICGECGCELRVQKRTRIIKLLMSLRFRSSHQRSPQGCANFGIGTLAIEAEGTYRPERHYMRGPGPKWREKHASFVRPEGRSFN